MLVVDRSSIKLPFIVSMTQAETVHPNFDLTGVDSSKPGQILAGMGIRHAAYQYASTTARDFCLASKRRPFWVRAGMAQGGNGGVSDGARRRSVASPVFLRLPRHRPPFASEVSFIGW
jgi:hypothetical protein